MEDKEETKQSVEKTKLSWQVRWRAIYGIWQREVLIFYRDPVRFFSSLFAPFLIFLIFGTGLNLILSKNVLGYDFSLFFYPGIMAVAAAFLALDATMSIVWDKEFGFLKEILVAPVKRIDITLGRLAGATSRSLIQTLTLLLVAPFIGIPLTFARVVFVILLVLLISWGMAGLGIILALRAKRLESYSIILQLFFAPLVAFSGAFFPLYNAPYWIRFFSHLNPLTYGVDSLRFVLLASSLKTRLLDLLMAHNLFVSLLVASLFMIITTIFSVRSFKKIR
jgi:ABC-2 type transport system permease protein